LIGFTSGIYSLASSTIGNGTQTGGLTISGGATTTGNAYFAGSVGIGTAAPGSKLDIVAPSAGPAQEIGSLRLISSADSNKRLYFGVDSISNYGWIQSINSGTVYLPTVINASGGNVGVGNVTSPQSKLDINGNVSIGSYAGNNAAPSNGLIVSGNVGIGTTNPSAKLDISTGASQDVVIGQDVNGTLYNFLSLNGSLTEANGTGIIGGGDDNLYVQSKGTVVFRTGGVASPKITIDASGNLGIGTTTLSSLLSVQGNGLFSGNITAANITATGTLSILGGLTAYASSTIGNGTPKRRPHY
jgi:hypothetical protein